jgi:hypothetical protein
VPGLSIDLVPAYLLLIPLRISHVFPDTLIPPYPIHALENVDLVLLLLRQLEELVAPFQEGLEVLERQTVARHIEKAWGQVHL